MNHWTKGPWARRWSAGLLGLVMAMALTASAPREAEAQGLVEYALILVLAETVEQYPPPIPAGAVLTDFFGARVDDLAGALADQDLDASHDAAQRLLGPAHALRGAYNACSSEECDVLEGLLDLLIDALEALTDPSGPGEPSPDP
ncbi:MAG TPA: hypothetical protein VK858_03195 [Longimicrobiales bacterium]|nr:hypothetical protein [Longimicrobiales bacterium]